VLLILGLIAASIAKRRGPAIQSAIFRLTLLGVVACPLLGVAMLQSGASLLTFDLRSFAATNISKGHHPSPIAAKRSDIGAAIRDVSPLAEPQSTIGKEDELRDEPLKAATAPYSGQSGFDITQSGRATVSLFRTLFIPIAAVTVISVWLLVTSIRAVRVRNDLRQASELCRRSVAADDTTQRMCDRTARRLNVRSPDVRVTPTLNSPCLIGHRNPILLLPEDLPAESLEEVFLHELAHVRRHDWAWNVVGRFTLASAVAWRLASPQFE
jgi:beta-lactamase regulating signal transducer with metallopeptidase domain